MNPEQYLRLQEAFLELRELDAVSQEQRLADFQLNEPELVDELTQLLKADQKDSSFLENPVVDRDQRIDIETKDMRPEDSETEAESPTHIGPYRVLQKIGEGGHGVVFMAEQLQPIRRKVAIKWIKRGMDSDLILARFEAEWQALAMMNHPSIANVIEAKSTDSGQPYFVMELVHGIPIDEFCDQNKLDLNERLLLFQQVCSAVHHAHQKGIIHRDIKPANVLITTDSGKPLAKVIDFGIAKALHLPLTEKTMFTEYGQIVGTLEYMSPEQALMSQTGIDVRSDVYSLGVLLYLLLTGETPVSRKELLRDGIWELKNVLQSTQPQTPSTRITSRSDPQRWRDHAASDSNWVRNVSGDLDWITMKAIAREPDRRYDSAAEFASDINRYLQGDAIEARPPSRLYRFQKFVQKNRIAVVSAAAVGVSILTALFAFTFLYFQSRGYVRLIEQKSNLLKDALGLSEEYSAQLSKALSRQTIESAWDSVQIGDVKSAFATLEEIQPEARGNSWQLCKDIAQQYQLPVFRSGFNSNVRTVCVDETGHRIAVINSASAAEIWDGASLNLLTTIELPKAIYTAASFSNADSLLVGGPGNKLTKIDLGSQSFSTVGDYPFGAVRDIDYDEARACWWLTSDQSLVQIDESDLSLLSITPLRERVKPIAISKDGELVAIGSLKGNVLVANPEDLSQIRKLNGIGNRIGRVGFDEGKLIAVDITGNILTMAVSKSGLATSSELSVSSKLFDQPVSATLGVDSKMFSAYRDGSLWLFEDGMQIPLRVFPGAVRNLAWLASAERLFTVHADGRISVLDRREISRRKQLSELAINIAGGDIGPSQKFGATSHNDGFIRVWNSSTGSMMSEQKLHSSEPLELAINPAGDLIASVALDQSMVLCSLPDLRLDRKIKIGWGVRTPAFSPNGKLVAGPAAADDPKNYREGTIDIWDIETGKPVNRLVGHENWVLKTRFISQSELISLSVDGTLKFWSIDTEECLETINFSAFGNASCFAYNASTEAILVGHSDGVISTWDRKSGKLIGANITGSSSIAGLSFAGKDQSVLIVAVENEESILLLDEYQQIAAKLNSGVGPLRAFRSQSNTLLLVGSSGISRILKL